MHPLDLEAPRRDLAFQPRAHGFRVTLKRNCSISPAGFALVCAALAALALAIAAGFAAAGAWLILPFAGLEALALGAAFVLYARRAADYETIELDDGRLSVETADGGRVARVELDARRARLRLDGARVLLGAPGRELELGRHLDAAARVAFAGELGRRLGT